MPDPALLTPLGIRFRAMAPTVVRDDPDYLAAWHGLARECERLKLKIDLMRRQFFPQTADELLKVWEYMVGVTIEPSGATVEERRQIVLAKLLTMGGDASGLSWQQQVTALIGSGWSYEEHVPGDVTTPPEDTIRVTLPFPPTSGRYRLVETMLREITQAHVDIVLVSIDGFRLDTSQMDQEGMGV